MKEARCESGLLAFATGYCLELVSAPRNRYPTQEAANQMRKSPAVSRYWTSYAVGVHDRDHLTISAFGAFQVFIFSKSGT